MVRRQIQRLQLADWLAAVVVFVAVVVSVYVGIRGYFWSDDWVMLSRIANEGLNPARMFEAYGGHLQPATLLLYGLGVAIGGGTPWLPMVVIASLLLAGAGITTWLAVRSLVGPRPVAVVALLVPMFSALSYPSSTWIVVAVTVVPVWLFGGLAIFFHAKMLETNLTSAWLGTFLSVVAGLLFLEKAILIPVVLFMITAGWFVRGGFVESLAVTLRSYWRTWAAFALLGAAYAIGFALNSQEPLRPAGLADAGRSFASTYTQTVGWILAGGPWRWFALVNVNADGNAPTFMTALAVILLVGLVVISAMLRRQRLRIWLPWFVFVGIATIPLLFGRVSTVGWGVTHTFRHFADGAPLLACTLAVAFFGLRIDPPSERRKNPAAQNLRRYLANPVAVGCCVALFSVSTLVSASAYRDIFSVNPGRSYSDNLQADLAANPGARIFNSSPPAAFGLVVAALPFNTQESMFKVYPHQPEWVTSSEKLTVIAADGHLKPGVVDGPELPTGTAPGCGTLVDDTARIPLTPTPFSFWRAVYLQYYSKTDTVLTVRVGSDPTEIPVKANQWTDVYAAVGAFGGDLDFSVPKSQDAVCLNKVVYGTPVQVFGS
ncbi:MAG: hypothetical protein ACOYD0_12895 [Candidatus Nanopelagicales bacterium]